MSDRYEKDSNFADGLDYVKKAAESVGSHGLLSW
jgi:hypothetical protein